MRYATFNRFEIEMPDDAVRDCSHRGRCDDDVTYWEQKIRIDASAYRDWETDRKSTRLNSSHLKLSRMPSSA